MTFPVSDSSSRPLVRLWLLLPLIWLVIGVVFAAQLAVLDNVPVDSALTLAAFDWLPWIIASPVVLWLGRRYEFTSKRWGLSLLVHLLGCLVLTCLLELVFMAGLHLGVMDFRVRRWGGGMPPRPAWSQEHAAGAQVAPAQGTDEPGREGRFAGGPGPGGGPGGGPSLFRAPRARMTIPLYWVLVAVAHALLYHRRSIERERRAQQAEAGLAEARMATLQAQLNPHFLFNTLNTIAQFVHEDVKACERMIEGLAQLLRASLAASGRRLIPLREELALADCYLDIQQGRFPDRLTVVREIEPEALERQVPTLLIQPLLENAILHGTAPHRSAGTVTVRIRPDGPSGLCIEIIDTGDGAGTARHGEPLELRREGIGLRNTRERLAALYGTGAEFTLTWHAAGGACSRVLIRTAPLTNAAGVVGAVG